MCARADAEDDEADEEESRDDREAVDDAVSSLFAPREEAGGLTPSSTPHMSARSL